MPPAPLGSAHLRCLGALAAPGSPWEGTAMHGTEVPAGAARPEQALGRCSELGVLVQPASFPIAQQHPPFSRASVSPLQCFTSPGKAVSPGQHWETPVLLQTVPSWGWGCRGHTAGRVSPWAQAGQRESEKLLACKHARTRLQQSCWHACPPQACHSRALHQLCLPAGTGTCGVQAAPPGSAQAVPGCPTPPLQNTGNQPRPAPSHTVLGWDLAVPASSSPGVLSPWQIFGLVPPPECPAPPVTPQPRQDGDTPAPEPSLPRRAGAAYHRDRLGVGVEATGRGAQGGLPCSPSVCGP